MSASATADSGSDSAEGTSTIGTTDPTATDTSTTGSTGEPPSESYPPCNKGEPVCPEPYTECAMPGGNGAGGPLGQWCTFECMDDEECPEPSGGSAVPICAGPPEQPTFCMLNCAEGECPEGMMCLGLGPGGMAMRCAWPPPP